MNAWGASLNGAGSYPEDPMTSKLHVRGSWNLLARMLNDL
jgi:hypothetical protein